MQQRTVLAALAVLGLAVFGCGGRRIAARGPIGRGTSTLAEPPIVLGYKTGGIAVLAADGSSRTIVSDNMDADQPFWLFNHSQILFRRSLDTDQAVATSLWTVKRDGQVLTYRGGVTPPDQMRFIAADSAGTVIAFDDDRGIWVLKPWGTAATELVRDPNATDLAISADGSTIAYVSSGLNNSRPSLATVRVRGGAPTTVFPATAHACGLSSPTWSPDKRWIAFDLCVNIGGPQSPAYYDGIWAVRGDGRDVHRIVADASDPTWSPDGRWIAFLVRADNAANTRQLDSVVEVHPDGTNRRVLARYPAPVGEDAIATPHW
jgi:hypothetical protein